MSTKQKAQRAVRSYLKRRDEEPFEVGLLGYIDENGSQRIEVPARANRCYVRIRRSVENTVIDALNYSVPKKYDLPVQVKRLPNGDREIVGVDRKVLEGTGADQSLPSTTVAPHSHRIGFGLEDLVEARRFEPGLVKRGTGNEIMVDGFFYRWQGNDYWFPGEVKDVTDYVPGLGGQWCWLKVGFDPENVVLAVDVTASVGQDEPLSLDDLATLDLGNAIFPLAGIKMFADQTEMPSEYYFYDMRQWITDNVTGSAGDFYRDGSVAMTGQLDFGGHEAVDLGAIQLNEDDSPFGGGSPPSNTGYIYLKSDGKFYGKNDAGTEYDLTASGGGGSSTPALVYSQTTDVTAAESGGSEKSMIGAGVGDLTLDANTFADGDVLRITLEGSVQSTSGTPKTIQIYLNSVAAAATILVQSNSLGAFGWRYEALILCKVDGASGVFTVTQQGYSPVIGFTMAAPDSWSSIDTTSLITIDVTLTGSGTTNDSWTSKIVTAELLKAPV